MILTTDIIDQGRSKRGGWSALQFRALGLTKQDMRVKGWKDKVLGIDMPEESINRFLSLKDQHLKKRKKNCRHSFEFVTDNVVGCIYCQSEFPIDERSEKI